MIRVSQKWIIYNKDLESRMVQVKNFRFGNHNFVEYWIYKPKMIETGLIYPHSGRPIMREEREKRELKAIICCPTTHIRKKFPQSILIEGVKFSNEETNDVNEYLRKTGRTTII